MSNRSSGSKLGAISGLVIVVAFFLPWVKACNRELTGYDIATNSTGQVEDAWIYWLTLLTGAFCLLLLLLVRTDSVRARTSAAVARLVAGLVGFLPLLNIWYNVEQRGGAMEILYGGWVTVSGYAGIALSFFVDLFGPSDKNKTDVSEL